MISVWKWDQGSGFKHIFTLINLICVLTFDKLLTTLIKDEDKFKNKKTKDKPKFWF